MTDTFTLKLCRPKKDSDKVNRAYLMSFSNGHIEQENSDNITFETYENPTSIDGFPRKKFRQILVATTDHLQYSGSNFEPVFPDGDQCNFYIGCLKKKKNVMKIYPSDIFRCNPVFKHKSATPDNETEKNYSEKVDELTEAFGSKHRKKSVKSRIRHKVDKTDMQEAVIEAVEESYIATKAKEESSTNITTDSLTSDVCPPRNKDATSEDEVYYTFDIISEVEYDAIEPQAQVLLNATSSDLDSWSKDSVYSKFVIKYLRENAGNVSLSKAKLLAYYDYISKFSKLRYAELRRKDIAPGIPSPFKEMLMEKFVLTSIGPNGAIHKSMPPKMKDKLISYALVLALTIEDFTVELLIFLSDYNLTIQKISKIAYALGCHILTRKVDNVQSKVAVLKLPLYIPKERPYAKGTAKG